VEISAAPAVLNSRATTFADAAVSHGATTMGAIRQRPARLYTGNSNPLWLSRSGSKKVQAI
jgi:hypothetical protein